MLLKFAPLQDQTKIAYVNTLSITAYVVDTVNNVINVYVGNRIYTTAYSDTFATTLRLLVGVAYLSGVGNVSGMANIWANVTNVAILLPAPGDPTNSTDALIGKDDFFRFNLAGNIIANTALLEVAYAGLSSIVPPSKAFDIIPTVNVYSGIGEFKRTSKFVD